jgi:hypothetical protein
MLQMAARSESSGSVAEVGFTFASRFVSSLTSTKAVRHGDKALVDLP